MGSRVARIAVLVALSAGACMAQSLGDVARQQQSDKKPASAKRVITNDDFVSESKPAGKSEDAKTKSSAKHAKPAHSDNPTDADTDQPSADDIKQGIKEQRQRIAAVESEVKEIQQEMEPWKVTDCTHVFHGQSQTNTCDIPQRLTAELNAKNAELDQEKKSLQEMQEQARKLGFANSVYDPN